MSATKNRVPYFVALALLTLLSVGTTKTADAQPRIRVGVEGGAGGEWGTPRGASVGIYGQLGLQLNDTFAIFYQPSAIGHALGSDDDADTFVAFGNIAMADLTLGFLQLGFGGGMDVSRVVDCNSNGEDCESGPRDVNPAIAGRVAGVISIRGPRARLGIPIGFQIHSTFFDEDSRVTSLLITAGIQRF